MSTLIKTLLICSLLWLPGLQAEPAGDAAVTSAESERSTETAAQEKEEGWSGFTIFVLVFVVSVLFVLSTATALTRMGGGQSPPTRKPRQPARSKKRSSLPKGEERFRL